MKILLTGANGYVGKRLLLALLEEGHHIVLLTRLTKVPIIKEYEKKVTHIHADLLDPDTLSVIPNDIDSIYYLVHSMNRRTRRLIKIEKKAAENFVEKIKTTNAKQIIFLSGIGHDKKLSHHLKSRHKVEEILIKSNIPTTILRCGIIIGSGSSSFEIIRDLVEKLPIIIAPEWINNLSTPIAIFDVIEYLVKVLNHPQCLNKRFEIGGPDTLSFKDMMIILAKKRHLTRLIKSVPFFSLKLSAYWISLITSSNYALSKYLVMSLKHDLICRDQSITKIIPKSLFSYEEALDRAFTKIQQNTVLSSWKDAWKNPNLKPNLKEYIQVPIFGCFQDIQKIQITNPKQVEKNIFKIGGKNGWYFLNTLWKIRGLIDMLVGGVGLRRGRRHPTKLNPGDSVDFWRVIVAEQTTKNSTKKTVRLLLYAEMKLPGEAWLEFKITKETNHYYLTQTATFRPKGVLGRLYWYACFPFHIFMFKGMVNNIQKKK